MTIQITIEMLGGGILHSLLQTDQFRFLGHHVDHQVAGNSVAHVGEPLKDIGILEGGDPHRAALIIDLGIIIHNGELADHIGKLTHLTVTQHLRRSGIQPRDIIIGDFGNILGEVAVFHLQQIAIGTRIKDLRTPSATDDPNQRTSQHDTDQNLHGKGKLDLMPLYLHLLHADEMALHQIRNGVHHAQRHQITQKAGRMDIDRRQGEIKVDCAE